MSKVEVAVRYVHGKDDMGARPMLGIRGKKLAHCVGVEYDKIYSVSIPLQYFDRAGDVMRHNDPYPIQRYLEMLAEKSAKPQSRISAKAAQILLLARNPDAFDEDLLEGLADEPPEGDAPGESTDPASAARSARKSKLGLPGTSDPGKRPKAPRITSPAAGTPGKRGRGRPPGNAGTGLIARVAVELKVDPAHLRKACRAAGLKAPYDSEKDVKAAWKKHGK